MLLEIALLIIGFILLVKCADWLVDGSSSIARMLGISPLIIGLTIVAFGTSAPELTVSLIAAMKGSTDLALGNIVGSNIANIGLILGLTALIRPLKVHHSIITKEAPIMSIISIVLFFLAFDSIFLEHNSILSQSDGLLLLVALFAFGYYVVSSAKKNSKAVEKEFDEGLHKGTVFKSIGMVIVGILGVVYGAKLVVDAAVFIAQTLGISEAVIGLSMVAFGTSLPELATSMVAAFKKQADIAVGNVIGSNISNILLVLGATASVHAIPVATSLIKDFIIMLAFSLLIIPTMSDGKVISRMNGALLFGGYLVYIVTSFI